MLAWWACTLASTLFGATPYIGKNLRYSQLPIDLDRDEDFAAYVDYYHARAFAPVAPILLATVTAAANTSALDRYGAGTGITRSTSGDRPHSAVSTCRI